MKRLLLLLSILPLLGFVGQGSITGRVGLPLGAEQSSGDYVTIAIFGDTQRFSNGDDVLGAGGDLDDMNAAVTWILMNRLTENIDLVMHVGDMIDSGVNLPLSSSCDGDTATPAFSTCSQHSGSQSLCEAEPGCGYATFNNNCAPCTEVDDTASEWTRFQSVFDRLHGNVPFVMVKGNHDQPGEDPASFPDRDTSGWDTIYDDTYWSARENEFTTYSFDHLQAEALDGGGQEGISRAWTTALDGNEMLIVAPGYESGVGHDQAQLDWMLDVLSNHPDKPAILLTHWCGTSQMASVRDDTLAQAPNLWLMACGHNGWASGGSQTQVRTNGTAPWTESLLDTRIDQTNTNPATVNTVTDEFCTGAIGTRCGGSAFTDTGGTLRDDYITLVRWWPGTDEVEITQFSAAAELEINNTVDYGADRRYAKASFEVEPPIFGSNALYDLTPYRTQIEEAFSDDQDGTFFPPQWPEQPTTTSTCNVTASSCTSLNTCLGSGNGVHVVVPAGTYACGIDVGEGVEDMWLDLHDDAVFTGTNQSISLGVNFTDPLAWPDGTTHGVYRFKMTGGTFTDHNFYMSAGSYDVTIDNVYVEALGGTDRTISWCSGVYGSCDRITIINSTFMSSRSAGLTSGNSAAYGFNDIIIAGTDVLSDYNPVDLPSGGAIEYGWRMQYMRRSIFVDNMSRVDYGSDWYLIDNHKPPLRIHYFGAAQLYTGNVLQCANQCLRPVWIDTRLGDPETAEGIRGIYLVDNIFENLEPGTNTDVAVDDSDAGNPAVRMVIRGNVSYTPDDTVFRIASGGNGLGLSEVTVTGNTAVPGLTAFTPFSRGATRSNAGATWPRQGPAFY